MSHLEKVGSNIRFVVSKVCVGIIRLHSCDMEHMTNKEDKNTLLYKVVASGGNWPIHTRSLNKEIKS